VVSNAVAPESPAPPASASDGMEFAMGGRVVI
jgi:hypothetical protein